MNSQLKTILLTVLTLSFFVIALVELSGVSSTALFNRYGIGNGGSHVHQDEEEVKAKELEAKAMPKTTITFDSTKIHLGEITEGTIAKKAFHFKNTGDNPLLIYNVVASCGCTIPSYPKQAIPPGGEGDIKIEFNSTKRVGHQQKNILVYSNGQQESMSIGFEVQVKEK